MISWRQRALLAILSLVVGFFSISAYGQQQRRPRDRVIAAEDIPITSFSCTNRTPGYYADVEAGCQVYHMCTDGGRQFSYKCPNTTLFQQRMLICAHWYQVNCSRSEQHYSANLLIGQRDKPFVEDTDYIHTEFNNGKGIKTLRNPDDLQSLQSGNGRIPNNQFFPNFVPVNTPQNTFIPAYNGIKNQNKPQQQIFDNTKSNSNFQIFNQNFNSFTPTSTPRSAQTIQTRTTFLTAVTPKVFQTQNTFISSSTPRIPQTSQTRTTFLSPNTAVKAAPQTTSTIFVPSFKQTSTTLVPTQNAHKKNNPTTGFTQQKSQTPTVNQNESFNNFIKRFNPQTGVELNQNNNSNDYSQNQYNFIKRFTPEGVQTQNLNINNNNENIAPFVNSNLFTNINNLVVDLEPPPQQPSTNLELPYEDADHMESNILELQFQDPRQVFFIPDSDSDVIPAETATPITISIPRHVPQQFHPMLFVNPMTESCIKCHPAFLVNKTNCTPCVVIR